MGEHVNRQKEQKGLDALSDPELMHDKNFHNLTLEKKVDILNKVDNFLEALYLSPHIFDPDVFKILRKREEKLTSWRHNSQFIGGLLFSTFYILRRRGRGFYFKNFCYLIFGTLVSGFLAGRLGEYSGNKLYYEKILWKLAVAYNVTDDEIEDMHLKMTEAMLKENKEEQIKKSSLDSVKFKF